jgi:pimeloyl-ACP methyl ester carboxylesterase
LNRTGIRNRHSSTVRTARSSHAENIRFSALIFVAVTIDSNGQDIDLKCPTRIEMYFFVFLLILIPAVAAYLVLGGPKLPPDTDAVIENVLKSELSQVILGEAGFVTSDGLQLWYESIAPAGEPQGVVLLNTGMAGDSIAWPPMFVRAFVDAGYRLIRYDFRGTGMSDWVKHWNSRYPYSLTDMAKDAVAVLDALNVEQAHLVGLSLGGMVAQEIAVRHPERVSSLTLMSTSGYAGDQQLPILPMLSSRHFYLSIARGLPIIKYRFMGGEKNLIKERIAQMIMAGIEVDIQETAEVVLFALRERKGPKLSDSYAGCITDQVSIRFSVSAGASAVCGRGAAVAPRVHSLA